MVDVPFAPAFAAIRQNSGKWNTGRCAVGPDGVPLPFFFWGRLLELGIRDWGMKPFGGKSIEYTPVAAPPKVCIIAVRYKFLATEA